MTTKTMATPRKAAQAQEPEWVVWLLVIAMLAAGLIVRAVVTGRTAQFAGEGVTFSYPADWANLPSDEPFEQAYVGQSIESGPFPAGFRLWRMPVTEISTTAQTLGDLALQWSSRQNETLLGYRVFGMEETSVAGAPAVKIRYAYVADPVMGGPQGEPVVARAEDLLLRQGDTVTIASFAAAAGEFEGYAGTLDRILTSLVLK